MTTYVYFFLSDISVPRGTTAVELLSPLVLGPWLSHRDLFFLALLLARSSWLSTPTDPLTKFALSARVYGPSMASLLLSSDIPLL